MLLFLLNIPTFQGKGPKANPSRKMHMIKVASAPLVWINVTGPEECSSFLVLEFKCIKRVDVSGGSQFLLQSALKP